MSFRPNIGQHIQVNINNNLFGSVITILDFFKLYTYLFIYYLFKYLNMLTYIKTQDYFMIML